SNLWEEYAAELTPEARLVHQLDKVEAYLQGWEYAADGRLKEPETLRSFQVDGDRLVTEPAARALLKAIEEWAGAADRVDAGKSTLKPE
ncbi:MAG: HD domain-containing protein, partial [Chloroflexota bacterium]